MGSYKFYDTGKYNFLNFFLNWEKKYLSEEIPAPPSPPKKKSSGVDCIVSWATRRSLHGVGFHRIENHGVTLLTVASWRMDFVSIKYISSFL